MTLDDIMSHVSIEGEIKIQRWDDDEADVIFEGYASDLDDCASYMFEDIAYMFACKNDYGMPVTCFEFASKWD